MDSRIEILPDVAALVNRAQAVVGSECQSAVSDRGQFTLSLAGGSTPKPLYERLATQSLPWDKIHIFWGDERYVPPTHPDSNEGMARKAWLNHVPIPETHLHPMPTQNPEPSVSAQRYDAHLKTFFGSDTVPTLDLILLGLGDDGHTASLFPRTQVLQTVDKLIDVGYRGADPRLTFTVPLINRARCVMFLVAGASKRNALKAIFAPDSNPLDYPAKFVQPEGQVLWLLDAAAGEGLDLT